jgi:hypothetical protein
LSHVPFLLEEKGVLAVFQVVEPEVAVAVGRRLYLLAGFDIGWRHGDTFGTFVGCLIEHRSRDELLKQVEVKDPRLGRKVGPQGLRPAIFLLFGGMAEAMPFQNRGMRQRQD